MLRYPVFFFVVLMTGCFSTRNSHNMVRVPINRFPFKSNTNESVYQMIDTASFYLTVALDGQHMIMNNDGKPRDIRSRNGGLKFYANGRVGSFSQTNSSEVGSLDPKKARMGLYCLNEDGFFAGFASHSPQAGVFIIKEKIKIKGDTLIMGTDKFEFKYLRKKLPDQWLVFKPDW